MSTMIATPAQLALHVLYAVLPRDVEVVADRIRFRDEQEFHDHESAVAVLEGVRKPISCRAREVDGVLEVHVAERDNFGKNKGNSLILDDLVKRAKQSRSRDKLVLVVGHEGNGIVTDIEALLAFERDYQILGNHFVRSDAPARAESHHKVFRVLSYLPSMSHTKVDVDEDV